MTLLLTVHLHLETTKFLKSEILSLKENKKNKENYTVLGFSLFYSTLI